MTADGRVIVTIDYTGTDESISIDTPSPSNNVVTLRNNADALPGQYDYAAYIYSPTTVLQDTDSAKPMTPVTDPSLAGGHADALQMVGGTGSWKIVQATTTNETTLAQGDDVVPVSHATADKHSTAELAFVTNLVNTNGEIKNATVVANIPNQGDDYGSEYTFQLTGPITVPENFTTGDGATVPIAATVLYSTQRASLATDSTAADLSGYVDKDQVTDWSQIRSVIIQIPKIPEKTATGRFIFNGVIPDMVNQGNRTGYIASGFYMDGAKLSLQDKDASASLTITGTSTIYARAHYIDANGHDQYIAFTDLDKTLQDNKDQLTNDYPTELSKEDQALIPDGYELSDTPVKIVDSDKKDGVAIFGSTVVNKFDGDFVQYELNSLTPTAGLTVTYVDDDANGAEVSVPEATQTAITGDVAATGSYTATVPTGYVLSDDQKTTHFDATNKTFSYQISQDDSDNITVHLSHELTYGKATTTRTITYVVAGDDAPAAPAPVTQTVNWKTVTDQVTNQTGATPLNAYAQVNSPELTGYVPD